MQKTKQMNVRLTEADLELIEQLKRDYGLSTALQTIRLALRLAQIERFPPPYPGMEKKK